MLRSLSWRTPVFGSGQRAVMSNVLLKLSNSKIEITQLSSRKRARDGGIC
jgi:hypothetical protein